MTLLLAGAPQSYNLVMSWPNKSAIYEHSYPSKARCEQAREIILEDNRQKVAAAEARVGTVTPMGRVVAASPAPLPSALCLPN